jgi:integrase
MADRTSRTRRSKGTGELFKHTENGPWIARWYSHSGKRPERSTKTTDRRAAERILNQYLAKDALRREGVVDATLDRHATEARLPLAQHVEAYLAHCERAGFDAEHRASKARHLKKVAEVAGITRLGELTVDALERYLASIKDAKRSARSVNFARQIVVTFMAWAVKTGRVGSNHLKVVAKMDEARDRRRIRRPLTDDELARLLAVAREYGREAWYLAAALAGLRKGDLRAITWADVNFTDSTLTIRQGKAKRVDVVPMHPQLAVALKARLKAHPAMPTARVWSETVGNKTRLMDFVRAGIARWEVVTDKDDKPVYVVRRGKRVPKMRFNVSDELGHVIDLHALRTTLGTRLARAGVAPQVAKSIMRHSDYRTTLSHYTVLGLHDTSAAVAKLPSIGDLPEVAQKATGTCDQSSQTPPPVVPLLTHETERNSAKVRSVPGRNAGISKTQNARCFAGKSDGVRSGAEVERKRLELSTPSLQS